MDMNKSSNPIENMNEEISVNFDFAISMGKDLQEINLIKVPETMISGNTLFFNPRGFANLMMGNLGSNARLIIDIFCSKYIENAEKDQIKSMNSYLVKMDFSELSIRLGFGKKTTPSLVYQTFKNGCEEIRRINPCVSIGNDQEESVLYAPYIEGFGKAGGKCYMRISGAYLLAAYAGNNYFRTDGLIESQLRSSSTALKLYKLLSTHRYNMEKDTFLKIVFTENHLRFCLGTLNMNFQEIREYEKKVLQEEKGPTEEFFRKMIEYGSYVEENYTKKVGKYSQHAILYSRYCDFKAQLKKAVDMINKKSDLYVECPFLEKRNKPSVFIFLVRISEYASERVDEYRKDYKKRASEMFPEAALTFDSKAIPGQMTLFDLMEEKEREKKEKQEKAKAKEEKERKEKERQEKESKKGKEEEKPEETSKKCAKDPLDSMIRHSVLEGYCNQFSIACDFLTALSSEERFTVFTVQEEAKALLLCHAIGEPVEERVLEILQNYHKELEEFVPDVKKVYFGASEELIRKLSLSKEEEEEEVNPQQGVLDFLTHSNYTKWSLSPELSASERQIFAEIGYLCMRAIQEPQEVYTIAKKSVKGTKIRSMMVSITDKEIFEAMKVICATEVKTKKRTTDSYRLAAIYQAFYEPVADSVPENPVKKSGSRKESGSSSRDENEVEPGWDMHELWEDAVRDMHLEETQLREIRSILSVIPEAVLPCAPGELRNDLEAKRYHYMDLRVAEVRSRAPRDEYRYLISILKTDASVRS